MATATFPSGLAFIDTNVWLYAFITGQEPIKAQRARAVIAQTSGIAISVNLIRRERFTPAQVRDVINDFYATYTVIEIDQVVLLAATGLLARYSFSYWDSLIVASALTSGAT